MRPLSTPNNARATSKLSDHDKKIRKRIDKFMLSVKDLLADDHLKLYALIFLKDNQYLHGKKAPQLVQLPIYTFSTHFYDACKKSKIESNRIEFTEGVMDRLAKAGLGKHYKEYISKKDNGASDAELNNWVWEKAKNPRQPKIRTRAKSQPLTPVSTSTSTKNASSSSPNPFGLPDGQSSEIQDIIWNTSRTSPAAQYAPSSAQSISRTHITNTPPGQPQPQPQPQPQSQNDYQIPSNPATFPQRVSVTNARLSEQGTFTLGAVWNQVLQCSFNRDGYVILLQYLVADMIPTYYANDSQFLFNQQFFGFVQSIANQRNSLNINEQRLWNDQLALTITYNIFGPVAHQALVEQMSFSGAYRTQVANWMPAHLPQQLQG